MKNYVPFLKAKNNEFIGLKLLDKAIANNITPFFDIPKKNEEPFSESEYVSKIKKIARKIELNLTEFPAFYVDDFDIDNSLYIEDKQSYNYVIESLLDLPLIPVIGIDRSDERNNAVFSNSEKLKTKSVAIRIVMNDLLSGLMDLYSLSKEATSFFPEVELIIDLRLIEDNNHNQDIVDSILLFLEKTKNMYSKTIVTGSSISPVAGRIAAPETIKDFERREIDIQRSLYQKTEELFFGDYTIVSPNYSDANFDSKIIQNIMTAKVIYSYSDRHYFVRGSTIKASGYGQYKTICTHIAEKSFFRGENYSEGDSFIANAYKYNKEITASSIIGHEVNSHISYMYNSFSF